MFRGGGRSVLIINTYKAVNMVSRETQPKGYAAKGQVRDEEAPLDLGNPMAAIGYRSVTAALSYDNEAPNPRLPHHCTHQEELAAIRATAKVNQRATGQFGRRHVGLLVDL